MLLVPYRVVVATEDLSVIKQRLNQVDLLVIIYPGGEEERGVSRRFITRRGYFEELKEAGLPVVITKEVGNLLYCMTVPKEAFITRLLREGEKPESSVIEEG